MRLNVSPTQDFASCCMGMCTKNAVISSPDIYDEAERDFEAFWATVE